MFQLAGHSARKAKSAARATSDGSAAERTVSPDEIRPDEGRHGAPENTVYSGPCQPLPGADVISLVSSPANDHYVKKYLGPASPPVKIAHELVAVHIVYRRQSGPAPLLKRGLAERVFRRVHIRIFKNSSANEKHRDISTGWAPIKGRRRLWNSTAVALPAGEILRRRISPDSCFLPEPPQDAARQNDDAE